MNAGIPQKKSNGASQRLARARSVTTPSDGLTCTEGQVDDLLSGGESTGEERKASLKRMVPKSLSGKIRVK
jgi:hypothetical protein